MHLFSTQSFAELKFSLSIHHFPIDHNAPCLPCFEDSFVNHLSEKLISSIKIIIIIIIIIILPLSSPGYYSRLKRNKKQ